MIGLFIRFCLRLRQSAWFSLDRKRNWKKLKRSDSCDPDSVARTTLLTTPLLDFH